MKAQITIIWFVLGLSRSTYAWKYGPAALLDGLPRGGKPWRFWNKRAPSLKKQLALEKDYLERQLRQAHEELQKTRKQLIVVQKDKNMYQAAVSQSSGKKKLQQEIRSLRDQIRQFEDHVEKIQKLKEEIERLLELEQEKVKALEVKLKEAAAEKDAIKDHYEKEMEKLRIELEALAEKRIAEMKKIMEERMAIAVEQAKLEAAIETEARVQQAETRVRKEAERQLQEEQQRSADAVEKEKVKMRKLVKALSEREKKLLAQAEERATREPQRVGTRTKTAPSNPNPGTVRPPRSEATR